MAKQSKHNYRPHPHHRRHLYHHPHNNHRRLFSPAERFPPDQTAWHQRPSETTMMNNNKKGIHCYRILLTPPRIMMMNTAGIYMQFPTTNLSGECRLRRRQALQHRHARHVCQRSRHGAASELHLPQPPHKHDADHPRHPKAHHVEHFALTQQR